jgi:hypothetical protein
MAAASDTQTSHKDCKEERQQLQTTVTKSQLLSSSKGSQNESFKFDGSADQAEGEKQNLNTSMPGALPTNWAGGHCKLLGTTPTSTVIDHVVQITKSRQSDRVQLCAAAEKESSIGCEKLDEPVQ